MRVLCLDVGERRIGVAVTDPLDITAQGVETIWTKGLKSDVARVCELMNAYTTDRVLIGLPRNMDGSEGPQAAHSRAFGEQLEQAGMNVRYQDERMTTLSATRTLIEGGVRREKRREVVDKLAACYILQSFLDAGGWRETEHNLEEIPLKKEVFRMADERNHDQDMEQENIVELFDEDGNALKFEHIMTLEHKGNAYICLAPAEPMEDVGEDEMVIMRVGTDEESGEDIYETIEDEAELDEVFEEYLKIAEADEEE
jgi:putative Holliday junction resolvase